MPVTDETPPPSTRPKVPVLRNMPTRQDSSLANDAFLLGPVDSPYAKGRRVKTFPLDVFIYLAALGVVYHGGGLSFTFTAQQCPLQTWLTVHALLGLAHRVFKLLADMAPNAEESDDEYEDDTGPDLEETTPLVDEAVSPVSPVSPWVKCLAPVCSVAAVVLAVCFFIWWCVGLHSVMTTSLTACRGIVFPVAVACLFLQGSLYFCLPCMVTWLGHKTVASLDGGLLRT